MIKMTTQKRVIKVAHNKTKKKKINMELKKTTINKELNHKQSTTNVRRDFFLSLINNHHRK